MEDFLKHISIKKNAMTRFLMSVRLSVLSLTQEQFDSEIKPTNRSKLMVGKVFREEKGKWVYKKGEGELDLRGESGSEKDVTYGCNFYRGKKNFLVLHCFNSK